MSNPVIGVDTMTAQGYFQDMATTPGHPRQTGGSRTSRGTCGSSSAPVSSRRPATKINQRPIVVKHSMRQLWHDMVVVGSFGIMLGMLTHDHILLTISLILELVCLTWYQVSVRRAIRKAVIRTISRRR